MFKSKKKPVDIHREPLTLGYYEDGSLMIPKKNYKEILDSIKYTKLKEIELLDYSINNLNTQLLIVQKMMNEKTMHLENSKQEMIASLKREINPDLLCQICFEKRVNIVLTPCGHTFCDTCFKNTTTCFNCRCEVKKTHKIYFS